MLAEFVLHVLGGMWSPWRPVSFLFPTYTRDVRVDSRLIDVFIQRREHDGYDCQWLLSCFYKSSFIWAPAKVASITGLFVNVSLLWLPCDDLTHTPPPSHAPVFSRISSVCVSVCRFQPLSARIFLRLALNYTRTYTCVCVCVCVCDNARCIGFYVQYYYDFLSYRLSPSQLKFHQISCGFKT